MYVIGQLSFPAVYSIAFLIYGFIERDTNVKKWGKLRELKRQCSNVSSQMICSNPLSLNGLSFQIYTYTSGIIYVFVFFIYLAVYVMLKSNKASKMLFRFLGMLTTVYRC